MFARDVKESNVKRLKNTILETANIDCISTFFRVVYNINLHTFEELAFMNDDEILEQRLQEIGKSSVKVKRKRR